MRYPSLHTLETALDLTSAQAVLVRDLMRYGLTFTDDPDVCPRTRKWIEDCYHRPPLNRPDTIMVAIDEVIGMYGTEAIWGSSVTHPVAEYCNAGDTYAPTILYSYESRAYRVTTFGNFVERYRGALR